MSTTQTLTERFAAPLAGSRVNREQGYIDHVLLCGTVSRNGRDYPVSVLKRDYARYEGAPVNCDHGGESTVDRRLGWISDVKPGADGRPRGRLHLLKSHPMAERVYEAAERRPSLFGMSHVAHCGTRRIAGRETVEAINKVISIDLVADPATTGGLYESAGGVVSEVVIPTDGKAFAEGLKYGWAPRQRVDGQRYAAWLKSRCDLTFEEYVARRHESAVPTDGKAFAESIADRDLNTLYAHFSRRLRGAK